VYYERFICGHFTVSKHTLKIVATLQPQTDWKAIPLPALALHLLPEDFFSHRLCIQAVYTLERLTHFLGANLRIAKFCGQLDF
jgi:hypothetical protein